MFSIEKLRKFLSLSAARTRTLRTNFLWNAAGNALFALSQWGVLVVFAKQGSPVLVGQLVYGLAITTPLFVVAGLQLRSIQATDASNRHTLGQYIGLRTVTTVAAVIVAIFASVVVWTAGKSLAIIVLLWALSKAVDSGSDTLYGFFQRSERMDYVGVSLALRGLLALLSVTLIFRASHSVPLALVGLAAGWSAAFLFFDIPIARSLLRHRSQSTSAAERVADTLRPYLDRRQLIPLCLEAAPLGVVVFLLAVQVQIPRYVVAGLLHTRVLGLFSAAAYLTVIGNMLVNALGAPACVRLAIFHFTGARSAFHRLITKLLLVAVALGVIGVLVSVFFGGRILTLLYTKEYAGMAGVLTMLCVASAISYVASFLGYAMTSMQRYKIQVPVNLCVVMITLLSCYWLTKGYGLMGTAVGVLIGNVGQMLMNAAVVWRTTWCVRKDLAVTSCEAIVSAEPAL